MTESLSSPPSPRPTAYSAQGGAIKGGAYHRYNNRPLYANNRDDVVIGGDRPLLRFGRNPFLYGTLIIGVSREGAAIWLHEAEEVEMAYRAGRLTWQMADSRMPGLKVTLDVVPMVGSTGMVLRLRAEGRVPGDRLFWAFGGGLAHLNPNADYDAAVTESLLERAFVPEDCADNRVEIQAGQFVVTAPEIKWVKGVETLIVGRAIGRCSENVDYLIADAKAHASWDALRASQPGELPLVCAEVEWQDTSLYLGVMGVSSNEATNETVLADLAAAFEAGWHRGEDLAQRCLVITPEARLDALAAASVAAVDGTWYAPYFVHSAMLWNLPYPGWRTICGGTMYGWRERLKETARYFIASQIQESPLTEPEADPARMLAIQSSNSRYYGKGRVTAHAGFYDMQSQFFDQLITEWRWQADAEYEAMLRSALDLHLEWMQECFDPDEDGAYESYINSWPTDSVWYNGGGSVEATSYAYRGHTAAWEMAQRAGDAERESFHRARLERIRSGFFQHLWVDRLGHPGKYREQGGDRRLHEDPWLYSLFLPIDAGLLSPHEAATTLNYARTRLQNDIKPFGGRMVWNSNWVPGVWSTRVDWPGDNYALALAYFQAGFGEDGWEVFKGTFLTSAYDLTCPGNLGHKSGGYDFGDCSHTFSRTLVEGLFGYNPDYPHGIVRLRPQFPADWKEAAIHLPDVSLSYVEKNGSIRYEIALANPAELAIVLPVRARRILEVRVEGEFAPYEVRPGMQTARVHLSIPSTRRTVVTITFAEAFAPLEPLEIHGVMGEKITLAFAEGEIIAVPDPQGIFRNAEGFEGKWRGELTGNVGRHLLLAEMKMGEITVQRQVQLTVSDPDGDAKAAELILSEVPKTAQWKTIDLASVLNGDVRTIFQQSYLSPRPNTVSVRLGTDGWTPWTSTFWGQKPPVITLEYVPGLLRSKDQLITPQGACFAWPGEARNIAFVSRWDNFPDSLTVSVEAKGEAVWLLIAGSTNPMQCGITNAIVRLRYAEGDEQCLELIPPQNFWALAPIEISGGERGQEGRHDYDDPMDAFCVPQPYPNRVELGKNCRAMLYGMRLKPGVALRSVTLEATSQEVVIGLMGLSVSAAHR